MKVLLIGGTGMIGSAIAAEAVNRGHEVSIVSRSGGEGRLQVDAADSVRLTELAKGHNAVVTAVSPPRDGSDPLQPTLDTGRSILKSMRGAGVKRLLYVGGAGSLLLPTGERLVDSPDFPEIYRAEALAHATLLETLREEAQDLDWTYISPAAVIAPGELTGSVRVGHDDLITDSSGESHISTADYAVVLVDELEEGANIRRRICAAAV